MVNSDREAVAFLRATMHANDIVLVKGSRAVGMDIIVAHIVRRRTLAVEVDAGAAHLLHAVNASQPTSHRDGQHPNSHDTDDYYGLCA